MTGSDCLALANQNSVYHRELMKDDYVNIKFSLDTCNMIAKGQGFNYEGDHYQLMENYLPSYNLSTGAYEYDMVFKAWYYALEDKIITLDGSYSAEWTLTDKPSVFLDILTGCIGANINYDNDLDSVIPFITLTFNGTNCLDALNMIVKALDPDCGYYEWWSYDNELYVGKLGSGNSTDLTIGTEIAGIQSQKGSYKKIDKLYAFGGTRNIIARYGDDMVNINANQEVGFDDGGTMITMYEDPNHKLKPEMFPVSSRVMDNYTFTNEYAYYVAKKGYNHVMPITFQSDRFIPSEIGKFLVKGNINTNIQLEVLVPMYAGEGSGCSEELTLKISMSFGSLERGSIGYINVGTYKAVSQFQLQDPQITTVNFKYNTKFDGALYEGETPCLFIKVDCEYPPNALGNKKPSEYEPTIELRDQKIEIQMEGENYGVWLDQEHNYLLNPYFLQPSDVRATLIDDQFEGVPYMIIKNKCPAAWFPLSDDPVYQQAKVTKRLTLPKRSNGYVGSATGVEGQIIFDDIFPSFRSSLPVCSIKSEEEEDTNGNKTGVILNYYSFTTPIVKDIEDDCYTEDSPKISFPVKKSGDTGNTSKLAGMEFELKRVKSDSNGTTFCIIPNDDYGCMLPNANLYPQQGDIFTLIGLDVSLYEKGSDGKSIVDVAQDELSTRATNYLAYINKDQTIYTCTMICTAIQDNVLTAFPSFGDKVNLTDVDLNTRVIGVQHPIDLPEADYQIICGNSPSYKRISALENKTLTLK